MFLKSLSSNHDISSEPMLDESLQGQMDKYFIAENNIISLMIQLQYLMSILDSLKGRFDHYCKQNLNVLKRRKVYISCMTNYSNRMARNII